MYFCVNCKNLLMKTNGERVLWKFYDKKDAQTHMNINYLKLIEKVVTSDLSPKSCGDSVWAVCLPEGPS